MRDLKRVIKNRNGFTLIELMVVVVILSLITIGVVTFFGGGIRSWIAGQNQLKAQRDARMALDRMVKEIREGNLFGDTSNSTTIEVERSIVSKPTVTFSWSGNSGDGLTENGYSFLENVHALNFIYMNQSGIIMTYPENASKVFINLQLDLDGDAKTGGNPDIILNTEVSLRNYKEED
jgi:prepilin-type N-terminal cleavage/methylation domain-containing protein